MKYLNLLPALLCFLFALPVDAAKKNAKPNVIIVITDDQGKNDLGCEGNPWVKTPNIDKFYENAVRLTNFHVSTTCAPSRGSLMTGRHTDRINVFHTIAGRSILFEDEVIMPQIFKQNGYVTGMFGKWHLGDNYPYRPQDRGFDEVVCLKGGGVGQGPDYWGNDYFDDTYWHNGIPQKYEGYCTDVWFNEAIRFIRENKEQPFFCYLSTNAPHGPYNCPEEYMDLYKDNPKINDHFQRFYGMITNIDDNFKRLEDELNKLGLDENTILIFMTDNGSAGGQRMYDAGMTGGKGDVTEGGHRVPFYIQWPAGDLVGGRDIDALTAHYDILPTFIDLLGLKYNPVKPFDGKSLVPLLRGEAKEWPNRILFMDTQREQNLVKYKTYTVMDDNWRLVNGKQLHNVTEDLKQSKNLIEGNNEIVQRLSEGYERWWQSLLADGVDQRYAYIKVGTPYENPTRLMSHDMMTGKLGWAWHQYGAITPEPASGVWKVEFTEKARYRFSLCRFPREANLSINATFPAQPKTRRIDKPAPASTKDDFTEAFLYVGGFRKSAKIGKDDHEVTFETEMAPGKYDLEAQLIDSQGRVYPVYYLYIEKL